MTSPKKLNANRANAQASTGPKTARGKTVASGNATRHGILSRELLLPHENPAEFDALLGELIAEMGAVGTLECTLVERIAVAIWRQRRLVRAEHQDIQQQNDAAVDAYSGTDPTRFKVCAAGEVELTRFLLSCEPYASQLDALEREVRMLVASDHMTFQEYTKSFPLFSRMFPAPTEEEVAKAFARVSLTKMHGPAAERQAKWLPAILQAKTESAKLKAERAGLRAISTPRDTDRLARYQAALDNEWYKAMRAFREARKYRLDTLENLQNYETNPKLPGPGR
jgi:hypothetical protein